MKYLFQDTKVKLTMEVGEHAPRNMYSTHLFHILPFILFEPLELYGSNKCQIKLRMLSSCMDNWLNDFIIFLIVHILFSGVKFWKSNSLSKRFI